MKARGEAETQCLTEEEEAGVPPKPESKPTTRPVTGDSASSDERSDIGHDEDVHPNALTETNADVLDTNIQTSRDVPDTNFERKWDIDKDDYEDADWHPPSSVLETHPDLSPEIGTSSSEQCGEYSSHLTSSGHCRLMATLPPVAVGTSQKRCPDMFRCTDDISYWLHENQNRKEQLDDLTETMSELQEELRNHSQSVGVNLTFDQRLSSLELRQVEVDALFHVHGTLLYELQAQLRNLSAALERVGRKTGCKVNVVRTSPLLGMRDTPVHPDHHHGHHISKVYGLSSAARTTAHKQRSLNNSGTVEDSFGWYHDQQGFSTPDTGNICAEISHAGWWFHQCFYANLNGVYYRNLLGPDGIVWFSWKDSDFYSLKVVTMMIRPRNFRPRLSP
ncbi:hypothetical protein FQN60_002212 [Etheostoma spectabile]|uniref:Fibrinogen C-terminal domain-containing protein n=1 Tax=Etheostoma spectabile TaxID=54343 RepID=A0A5J5DBZ5_9PERO|nr:hypothetical protein FQN60_002212 [Etheostoma spectabile]